jgi:hypothetical protein
MKYPRIWTHTHKAQTGILYKNKKDGTSVKGIAIEKIRWERRIKVRHVDMHLIANTYPLAQQTKKQEKN